MPRKASGSSSTPPPPASSSGAAPAETTPPPLFQVPLLDALQTEAERVIRVVHVGRAAAAAQDTPPPYCEHFLKFVSEIKLEEGWLAGDAATLDVLRSLGAAPDAGTQPTAGDTAAFIAALAGVPAFYNDLMVAICAAIEADRPDVCRPCLPEDVPEDDAMGVNNVGAGASGVLES